MAIIKKTIYLHHQITGTGSKLSALDQDFSVLDQYTLLAKQEVEFDVGDYDGREKEIEAVEKALEQVRANSQQQINLLLDRISKLKAITHDVEVAS